MSCDINNVEQYNTEDHSTQGGSNVTNNVLKLETKQIEIFMSEEVCALLRSRLI